MPPIMTRFVASLLCLTISVLPIHSYAGNQEPNIGAVGRDAKQFGLSIANGVKQNSAQVQDGKISLPVGNGQSTSININELFPGVQPGQNTAEYFPDAASPEELEQIFSDADAMDQFGNEAKANLFQDANSSNPSISGSAYQVLLDAANRSRPDFGNDPVLNLSKKTYEDMDLIADGFGDCSAETTISKGNIKAHIPDYERCQRVIKPTGGCDIIHSLGISSTVENVYVASQGRTWYTVQFDLKDGSWKAISPSDGEHKVAQIPTVDYNAMCSGAVNFKTDLIGSWDWPEHGIPGKIDSTVIYRVNQYPTCDNGLVGIVQIQDTTASDDLDWVLGGRFSFRFTKQEEDKWIPQSCIDDAQKLQDGFCTGSLNVVEGAQNDVDCIVVNGATICPEDSFYNTLKPSPLPGVPRLAQKVRLSKLQCDFNVGQMECWTDPQGVEHCPSNDGSNLNSCAALESNPQCGFISSECVDGAAGSSGQCYVFKDTYDCGTNVDVPTLEKNTEYQCGGPIRCMGDDCLDVTKTQSADFARATALLNAAQFMTQDMSCTDSATEEGGDQNIDQGCAVFGGESGECKIAVGGVSDCCEKPTNISFADYLNLIMAVPKLDGAVMGLSDGSAVKGAYQVLRDPVMSGWTEITQPFASYIENISGAVDSFLQPVQQFAQETIGALKEQITKLTSEALGNASATGAAGVPAGAPESMTEQILGQQGAAMLSTVMTVYTVYVVSMVMIQMIWKCEEKEFTMNAKRALNSCTYVGSYCKSKVLGACVEEREAYCCFNSPLSRIIQEQVRPQLGLNFGDARAPQCGGIPLDRIADIDWSKVNLDEWLGILQQNGKLPDPASLNLDALTGAGSDFNIDGTRQDASRRVMERLEGINVDKIRNDKAREIFPDLDGNGG
ncbi:conjugal transfer protein TraN [Vibrio cholerae]|uniref:Conjugal transfer protein TraN n=1 Tax=Vibrio cholerae TaxID=666 RepID=A0A395TCT9_VIBCL|nr:conjugal transfer protein TraN [Vibrio cholerae]RGP82373.1 conjugal transfer protein TraN [Vibrio cholerae]RGP82411.1 conjugal transfer protein TraN [Vibrio cholerae]RGP92887.1 conjugal transfer protein TraN [Vibrio cholerae]